MKHKILFIGIQGSGKGTQAAIVSKQLNIIHISTGDLLRNLESSPLKQKVDSIINQGHLIPDELMIDILKQRISKPDCKNGFILDGFPRNIKQLKLLENITKIDKAIEIHISDDEAVKRLSGRVSCEKCKAGYNIITEPKPKHLGICDLCGGKLIQRADDNLEAIKKRINTYHEETEPILQEYKKQNILVRINGNQRIEEITDDILKVLK